MFNILSSDISPRQRRIFFIVVLGIVLAGVTRIYFEQRAAEERGLGFASDLGTYLKIGLVSVDFLSSQYPEYRKRCFVANRRDTLQILADGLDRASVQAPPTHTLIVMEFTAVLGFQDGGEVNLTGRLYDEAPENLFFTPSLFALDEHGYWQAVGPEYRPLDVPGVAGWLQQQFRQHGCPML